MRKNASCSATVPRAEPRLAPRAPVRHVHGEAVLRIAHERIRAGPIASVDHPMLEIEGDALVAPTFGSRCPIRAVPASFRAALDGVHRLALRGGCVLMPVHSGNPSCTDCFLPRCWR